MSSCVAAACFSLALLSGFAEEGQRQWSRTFGSGDYEAGSSVQQTLDSGYIVAGYKGDSTGEMEVYLVKTRPEGRLQWSETFGGSGFEVGFSVSNTSDGGYIVAGCTASFGAGHYDVYLIKTTCNGSEEWGKTFGGRNEERGHFVHQTRDGGYVVAGFTESFGAGGEDAYLVKTDASGSELWAKTFGGVADERAYCVRETSHGNYIIAASTESFGAGSYDAYLIKTNADGDEEWSETFGGSQDDKASSVQETKDGGYISAGWTESFGAGSADVYLIKCDANGQEEWSITFGGSDRDRGYSCQQAEDGGYIVGGYTSSFGTGYNDLYLIKTDAEGNEEWTRTFGGDRSDTGISVQQASDGGYILVGRTLSFGAGSSDVYLVKTDAQGNAPLPNPVISSISSQESAVEITLRHISGEGYQLQSCDDLVGGDWVSQGDPVPGTGDLVSLFDLSAVTVRRRFYRVLCLP